ncbi:hypothetical protein ACUNWD_08825 [Sunxiuqinia sp. A32]|uniref:hypothetical protein n=1 Tax=Sunxiuqinia sp. A32 TaxID=3461496 RepID=UPI0040452873
METFKASIIRGDQNTILALNVGDNRYDIILTEDNPNGVKTVFNRLLQQLKNGVFNFELEDSTEDLYFHISKEYITQLNSELSNVYNELKDYELLNE